MPPAPVEQVLDLPGHPVCAAGGERGDRELLQPDRRCRVPLCNLTYPAHQGFDRIGVHGAAGRDAVPEPLLPPHVPQPVAGHDRRHPDLGRGGQVHATHPSDLSGWVERHERAPGIGVLTFRASGQPRHVDGRAVEIGQHAPNNGAHEEVGGRIPLGGLGDGDQPGMIGRVHRHPEAL